MTKVGGGGGGGFQGIDPHLLAQLTTSLKNGVGNAQPLAAGYLGRFSALGLDTSGISKLLQDYAWAQGQQPMLQRRYDLASHQPSGQWVNGMATTGAGVLQFGTKAQAQAAGAKAARQLMNGSISYRQFYAELRGHQNDPDWATGAVKTLGASGIELLGETAATPQDPTGQQNLQALAIVVAAAMGNGVTIPYSADPGGTGGEDPRTLAPLLRYASFPPQVLATLGEEAMAPGNSMYGQEIWQALAANSQASAMFIRKNAPEIVAWIHAGDHGGGLPNDQADSFLSVLKAGTVTIKPADAQLGGQAVTALVKAYDGNSGAHAPVQFDALYGQIVKDYWPDVMFSLTSPANSGSTDPNGRLMSPDGMNLTPDQWATFADEAMRDPETSAVLLQLAHAQGQQWQKLASQQPGGPAAGDSHSFQAGLVDGYFDYQAKKVYSELVQEGQNAGAWKDMLAKYAGQAVDTSVDVIADPGSAAETVTVAVTKQVLEAAVSLGVAKIPADGSPPPQPQYSTWQGAYSMAATDTFNNATPPTLKDNPGLQALVSSAKDYGGGSFLVKGKIPQDTSRMTTQQLAAYNAWLRSPAVAEYLIQTGQYGAWQIGYNASTTQESFGGG